MASASSVCGASSVTCGVAHSMSGASSSAVSGTQYFQIYTDHESDSDICQGSVISSVGSESHLCELGEIQTPRRNGISSSSSSRGCYEHDTPTSCLKSDLPEKSKRNGVWHAKEHTKVTHRKYKFCTGPPKLHLSCMSGRQGGRQDESERSFHQNECRLPMRSQTQIDESAPYHTECDADSELRFQVKYWGDRLDSLNQKISIADDILETIQHRAVKLAHSVLAADE